MHPGWVDTPGVQTSLPDFYRVMGPWLRTPEQGSDTMVWLATAGEPADSNGQLWLDRHRRWATKLPWTRTAPAEAEQLWQWVTGRANVTVADGPTPVSPG
jgi:dehydrogenase/reductase SDR family protein 12